MMNFVHAPVGAVIAVMLSVLGWPLWAVFAVAFLSHYVLDAILHWDPEFPWPLTWKLSWPVLLDFVIVIVILIGLFGTDWWQESIIWAGVLGGIFPDILLGLEKIFERRSLLVIFHEKVAHWWHKYWEGEKPPFWLGIWPQVAIVMILFWIVKGS